jgi:hypothetical protein
VSARGTERDAPDAAKPGAGANSRTSVAGAGWHCPASEELDRSGAASAFSWLKPGPLIASRNDKLARRGWLGGDPTDDERRRWMAALGARDLRVDRTELERVSFVLAGDTGEGDTSQLVTVPLLNRLSEATDFMVIASDVIYPAGGAAEYAAKFYAPYAGYAKPIYAIPGNHDWYDGLTGFMFHLCRVEERPAAPQPRFPSRAWLRELLWHRAPRVDGATGARLRAALRDARPASGQPAPYFLIDTGPLQLVCIDTGIAGRIDRDQARWLRAVSAASDKPKILVTGKPLYANGARRRSPIEGEPDGCVDEIVRRREHNYVAAIGGDVHNYQRYPVDVGDGRTIQYLVSGGGGAFMHATHTIPKVELPGVDEDGFHCYPLRGDSLSFYSRAYERRIPLGGGNLAIEPAQAAAYMAERLGMEPTKPEARTVRVTERTRRAAERVFPLPGQRAGARGLLQPVFSEFFDWNDPPLFKHLLHVEASASELRIRCLAATGCAGREAGVVEDEVVAVPGADRTWTWSVV